MKEKKYPLQTYLAKEERENFIKICQKLDNDNASMILRKFVQRQIKKHKDLL